VIVKRGSRDARSCGDRLTVVKVHARKGSAPPLEKRSCWPLAGVMADKEATGEGSRPTSITIFFALFGHSLEVGHLITSQGKESHRDGWRLDEDPVHLSGGPGHFFRQFFLWASMIA